MSHSYGRLGMLIGVTAFAGLLAVARPPASATAFDKPLRLTVAVQNLDTSEQIRNGARVPAGTNFQARAVTNGVDCAGQMVVTALGTPGSPLSALVNAVPMILGPTGSDSATSETLVAGGLPGSLGNDFKISASCNGSKPRQFAVATFEFFVEPG